MQTCLEAYPRMNREMMALKIRQKPRIVLSFTMIVSFPKEPSPRRAETHGIRRTEPSSFPYSVDLAFVSAHAFRQCATRHTFQYVTLHVVLANPTIHDIEASLPCFRACAWVQGWQQVLCQWSEACGVFVKCVSALMIQPYVRDASAVLR